MAERQEPKSKGKTTGRGGGHRGSGKAVFEERASLAAGGASHSPMTGLAALQRGQKSSPRSAHNFPTTNLYFAASIPALPPEPVQGVSCLRSKALLHLISRPPTTCHSTDYLHLSLIRDLTSWLSHLSLKQNSP